MSIIKIENLKVMYDQIVALDKVNLEIQEKEFIGIIGPNGGGKTTLVKSILGLLSPVEGHISIDKKAIMGYVPQVTTFDKNFPISVLNVVLTGHLPRNITIGYRFKGHTLNHANNVMKRLGIEILAKRQIGQLSGGQLQRVLIARALMNHPTVLILDEPTASVDEKSKKEIYEMLKDLNETITIIMITHDTTMMWPYIDRCVYINQQAHIHSYPDIKDRGDNWPNCPIKWFIEGEKIQEVLVHHNGMEENEYD